MQQRNYAVVIVTYNRLELLKECVSQALNQTYPFKNIYIVNNHSTDGTDMYLKEVDAENNYVHVFNLDDNIGGAGGFSFGMDQVTEENDYVLLIDDDAIISANYIEDINKRLENGILAYSGTVFSNGKIDTMHRRRVKSDIFLTEDCVPVEEYEKDSFTYDSSSFCGLLVSVKLAKQIGLPRKDFFIWHDDTEYSMRIRKHTLIKNVNASTINHKVQGNGFTGFSWKTYYGFRNHMVTGKEYSSCPVLFLLRRYIFHVTGALYHRMKSYISKDMKIYHVNCAKIHISAVKDLRRGVMGISSTFKPGLNLKERIIEEKY